MSAEELTEDQIAAEAAAEERAFEAGFDGEEEDAPGAVDEEKGDKGRGAESDESDAIDDSKAGDEDSSAEGDEDKDPVSAEAAKDEGNEGDADKALSGGDEAPDPTETRLRRLEGRFGTLNRDLNAVVDRLEKLAETGATKQVEREGGDAPTKEQIADAKQSSEKFDALKEEFPEWAEAMEEQINLVTAKFDGKMVSADDVKNIVSEALRSDREAQVENIAKEDLESRDWEQTVSTPEFRNWIHAQEDDVFALAQSPKWSDAKKLLDKYAEATENVQSSGDSDSKRRVSDTERLRGAVTPTKGGARRTLNREPNDEEDFIDGFKNG